MILVDTSVWIDHLRRGNSDLTALLIDQQVMSHRFVVGELACGEMKNRREILALMERLPRAQQADDDDVLDLIEVHRLYGRGLGWIDTHLLASAILTRVPLWTVDNSLARVAAGLRVSMI